MFFIVYVGNFVCDCGVATDISKRLINCTLFCEQFDEVITSFIIYMLYHTSLNIVYLLRVRVQFNGKQWPVVKGVPT